MLVDISSLSDTVWCKCCKQPAGLTDELCRSSLELAFTRREYQDTPVCKSCYCILEDDVENDISWSTIIRRRAEMLRQMAHVADSDAGRKSFGENISDAEKDDRVFCLRKWADGLIKNLTEDDDHRKMKIIVKPNDVKFEFEDSRLCTRSKKA